MLLCVGKELGLTSVLIHGDKCFIACFCTVTAMNPSPWQSLSSDAVLVVLVPPNCSYHICSREKSKCAERAFQSPVTQNVSPRLYLSLLVRLVFFLSNTAAELPTVRGVLWHGDYFHTSQVFSLQVWSYSIRRR